MGKVPPHAAEIESAIIGLILVEKQSIDIVAKMLVPESFYLDANRGIYSAIMDLYKDSKPYDLLSTVEQLRRKEMLEHVGGIYYLTSLTNSVVNSASLEQYCRIVYEKYLLREQIRIYGEGIIACQDSMADGFQTLDETSAKLITLSNRTQRGEVVSIDSALVQAARRIDELRHSTSDLTGVTSGFRSIDMVTYGWQAPDLIILAARPSVGKTAFALNLARNAAICGNVPTVIFSLEMSTQQVINRILAAESEIWLEKIQRGKLSDKEMNHLYVKGIQPLSKAPLFFDDTPGINVLEVRAKCRRLKNANNIGLIVIDYLQLMGSVGKVQNREQEIAQISRSLKALAKELNIPIIALSQLSRDIEKRTGGKPQLSDLRESGAIEQDADVVGFITRPDYQKEDGEIDPALQNLVDIKFQKSRNGKLETVHLTSRLEIMKFYEDEEFTPRPPRLLPMNEALTSNGYYERDEDNPF